MKILVVDDNASNRKLLQDTLRSEGVTTFDAADGIAALETLNRESIDAVISDLLMPRLDGYRLFREIRLHPRLRHVLVIAYTSTYLSPDDEQLALHAGADHYLRQPVPVGVLLRLLAGHLPPDARPRPPAFESESHNSQMMSDYTTALARKLEEKSAELVERNDELGTASHEFAESRARSEGIIASAMDAIVTVNESDHIVLFNAAAETMFGTSAAATLGRPVSSLLRRHGRLGDPDFGAVAGTTGPVPKRFGVFDALSGRRANGEEFAIEASFSIAEVTGKQFFTLILRDISERKRAEEQLRLANEQLRALTARNETIRERERTTVAREIHDVLAQELTCLKIDLVWIAKKAALPIDEPTRHVMTARIGDAMVQTDAAITTVQRIATELRPVILDSLGLPAAIEWQVEDFGRRSGLICRTDAPPGNSRLSRECATAVFRILQESLTNIARHAHATQANVEFVETADLATLVVTDNGRGITPAQLAAVRSIGLVGMHERAQAFGGTVVISSGPLPGTTVRVRIPLDDRNTTELP